MKVLVSAWGSGGDVLPALSVGWELRRRGHAVSMAANPYHAAIVREAGLTLLPVGDADDHRAMISEVDLLDNGRLSEETVFQRHYYPTMQAFHERALEALDDGAQVLVGGEIGSVSAAESRGRPWFRVVASPGCNSGIDSRSDPLHPQWPLRRGLGWMAATGTGLHLYWRLFRLRHGAWTWPREDLAKIAQPTEIAAFRRRLGLPPRLDYWPHTTLAMWPDWFAPPQPDWPPRTACCGFPLYPRPVVPSGDGARNAIVVTSGTVASGQTEFYAKTVAAAAPLGFEVLLVTSAPDQLPKPLPLGVKHLAYAPFAELFSRVALVVHHGGVGTAAYALAAGVPQLALPLRGDQFDNGNRLRRLGVAAMHSTRHDTVAELSSAMRRLLNSPQVAQRCRRWRQRLDVDAGLREAASRVEAAVVGSDAGLAAATSSLRGSPVDVA